MKPGDLVRCISGPEKFLGIGCIEVIEEQNATLSFFHLPAAKLLHNYDSHNTIEAVYCASYILTSPGVRGIMLEYGAS